MKEESKGKDNIKIEITKEDGTKEVVKLHNTITTAGKACIAECILASVGLNKPTHMALGTGTPAANALGAEVAASRTAFSSKTRSTNVVTMVTTFGAGVGTGTIIEMGIFDAASSGNMLFSAAPTSKVKAAGDVWVVTWTWQNN